MKNAKLAVKLFSVVFSMTIFLSGCANSGMVWIPTRGGEKYHCKSTCSGMIDPDYVTLEYAISHGYDQCKVCY